jgi:uncharacterized repeat protein (TIGR03803 family)
MYHTKTYFRLVLLIFIFSTGLRTASAQFRTGYYAMTTYGGTYNRGAILLFDSACIGEQLVWSLGGGSDGALPYGNLTYDPANGLYYGMTLAGGAADSGTIISYNPLDTTEQVVWSFRGGSDGLYPSGSLSYDTATGLMIGMTSFGGTNGAGTIFSFDPVAGRDSVLWTFGTDTDGAFPQADLRYDGFSHSYYATTLDGGSADSGAIIRYNTLTGAETVVYSFPGGAGGCHPTGNLTYNPTMGTYYGTTYNGGIYSGGTIFAFGVYFDTLQVVWNFGQVADGYYPTADLVYYAATGVMYGMAPFGGADSAQGGVIYIFDPLNNAERVVWSFGYQTDGARPFGNLTFDQYNNDYHGMTSAGGDNGKGIVFTYVPVHNQEYQGWSLGGGTFGATPYGSLIPFTTQISTGISQVAGVSALRIYPNPNSGSFILQSSGVIGQEYIITDMLGRVVAQQTITSDNQNIKLQNISAGSYILSVKGNNSKALRFEVE